MTKIVAILNITPDSFSDGGKNFFVEKAISSVEEMIAHGVEVIDIGAESSRPGAKILNHDDEWYRLGPVLMAILPIIKDTNTKISVDSYHYETIEKAISLGIHWVNDISGCIDKKIIDLVLEYSHIKLVLMHNLGIHANPKITIQSPDYLEDIRRWAEEKIISLKEYGIKDEQIIFDPGIGFGKTSEQSLNIIKNIKKFSDLAEIMVGHSRKSYISLFSDEAASNRDIETYITSVYLAINKVDYLRVHNFVGNKKAINTARYLW